MFIVQHILQCMISGFSQSNHFDSNGELIPFSGFLIGQQFLFKMLCKNILSSKIFLIYSKIFCSVRTIRKFT